MRQDAREERKEERLENRREAALLRQHELEARAKSTTALLQAKEEAATALRQSQEEAAESRRADKADQQVQSAILHQLWESMQSQKPPALVGTNDTISSITDTDNHSKSKRKHARVSTDGTEGTADTNSMTDMDNPMHDEEDPGEHENKQNQQ